MMKYKVKKINNFNMSLNKINLSQLDLLKHKEGL